MSSISNSLTSQAANSVTSSPNAPAGSTDQLTSKDTFLKLLVAQIKNQDPTSPTDSTQFVGQLTQYSELEQLIGIRTGITQLNQQTTESSSSDSTTNNSTKS